MLLNDQFMDLSVPPLFKGLLWYGVFSTFIIYLIVVVIYSNVTQHVDQHKQNIFRLRWSTCNITFVYIDDLN